ncbi:MAG TPA: MFS transporter [Thermomicrobiales bacterium]|jgi:MFS family permease
MQHSPEGIEEALAATAVATPVARWRLLPFIAFQLLTAGTFTSSIWVLWMLHRGYSLGQIGIAEACYHIAKVALEVPTGAFADTIGRKWSLAVSAIAVSIATTLTWWSPVFPVVMVALLIDGASGSFRYGADQAYLFDALKDEGRSHGFVRILANVLAASYFVAALMSWAGAWLSEWSYAWPFSLNIAAALITGVLASLLPEPVRAAEHRTFGGVYRTMRTGIRTVRERPVLLRLVLFAAFFFTANTLGNIYLQSVLKGHGFANGTIGLTLGISGIVSAAATWLGGRLPTGWRAWTPFTLLVMATALGTVFQGLAWVPLVLVGLGMREVAIGIFEPLFSTWTNDEAPSEARATVLSLSEFGFSVTMVWSFPLTGLLAERAGWGVAYGAVAAVLMILTGAVLLIGRKSGGRVNE